MASVVSRAQAQAQLQQNEVRCAAELVSLASYMLAHAGTTSAGVSAGGDGVAGAPGRAEAYARLALDTLEQCVADNGIVRAMCSPPVKTDTVVWICRQVSVLSFVFWRLLNATLGSGCRFSHSGQGRPP